MDKVELQLASRRQDAIAAAAALEQFTAAHEAPAAVTHDLQVVLDEALANVITHGYGGDPGGEILVRLERLADSFVLEIEDAGTAFDPLQAPPPDLKAPLRRRQVGGLGMHFVRSLMDEVSYTRSGGRNRLRLVKHVPRV
jgi:anti-sigma regulatory factor (Ser/Thr protein kinase)